MEIYCAIVARGMRRAYQVKHLSTDQREIELVFPFWIFSDGADVTLLDTGFDPDRAPMRGFRNGVDPTALLAEIGIAPADVARIIVSHMHWDHFCNPERYQNAIFLVQRKEVDYFAGYGKTHPAGQIADQESVAQIDRLARDRRLRFLDGDTAISSALTTYLIGGHTPGIQLAVAQRKDGPAVFACDTSHFYWNLEQRIPTPLINDYTAYMRGFEMIEQLRGDKGIWFPGHDPTMIDALRPMSANVYHLP